MEIILTANKRAFSKPENIIHSDSAIPTILIFNHQERYKRVAKVLETMKDRYPDIRGYVNIFIKDGDELNTALFALGELNILNKMQSLVKTLLEMPENIQDGRFIRWRMTSF